MALLGTAALAMWWNVAPAHRAEFEDWHAHEHFPERLSLPGFNRGTRWANQSQPGGVFVLYELEDYATLTSPAYMARLNAPTPWSVRMMPHHHGMVRSQCRVVSSSGCGVGGCMLTVRLSPPPEQGDGFLAALRQTLGALPTLPGLTSAHLLRTETPEAAKTTEQTIRGRDSVADWIVLVSGYDREVLEGLCHDGLSAAALGVGSVQHDLFQLAYALTAQDRGP